MNLVRHRANPEYHIHFSGYKGQLREDFLYACSYCLLHEFHLNGRYTFAVDHFRPKGLPQFWHLKDEYTNFRYACGMCNVHKWKHWPSPADEAAGRVFVDVCHVDPYRHYAFDSNGSIGAATAAGAFTIDVLRLNRQQLRSARKKIGQRIARLLDALKTFEEELSRLQATGDRASRVRALEAMRDDAIALLREEIFPKPVD